MKEQVQVPFDSNSSAGRDAETSAPKTLGRPTLASSLLKPKLEVKTAAQKLEEYRKRLFRHCSCGSHTCDVGPNDPPYYWVYVDSVTLARVHDEEVLPHRTPGPGGRGVEW